VSLGLAGGSAQADNGQSIILGAACAGSGTDCATSETGVENTGSGPAFVAQAASGFAGLWGINSSNTTSGEAAGVRGDGAAPGTDGVFGTGQDNGVLGETSSSSFAGVVGNNLGGDDGVEGFTAGSGASGVYGQNTGGGNGVGPIAWIVTEMP